MVKLDCPLQLSPVVKPKIWGRADLSPVYPDIPVSHSSASHSGGRRSETRRDKLIGEVWVTDDSSRFLNGPLAGMSLAEASQKYGSELNGVNWHHPRFPILAKYIFTSAWLSVQVHPDDDYARMHDPGNFGKCEMWYIIHVDREGELLLGARPGVTKDSLREAFKTGTSRELLNRFRPEPGEAMFVPPGTVHALGPGLVLFEVEENSDLTYRLDDFGRLGLDGKPRPLHIEKGLEVTRVDAPALRNLPRIEFPEPFGARRYVLASRFFALEELTLERPAHLHSNRERVEVLSMISGEGRVEISPGWFGYRPGDTWVIPPDAGEFRLTPVETTRVLKYYVPDLDSDFREPLRKKRVPLEMIRKIVFD